MTAFSSIRHCAPPSPIPGIGIKRIKLAPIRRCAPPSPVPGEGITLRGCGKCRPPLGGDVAERQRGEITFMIV